MMDKKEWQKVPLEQIVKIVINRVDNPKQSEVKRYLGLEHLDTDDLKIKRFGLSSETSSSKFLCEKGDIIFGRRRAYLRKLAISDGDYLVSTDAMIFRPGDPILIYPDFVPFFMQSENFWKMVLSLSEGSMSPRVKWKSMRNQEFLLPSIQEQKEISRILWAVEHNSEKIENVITVVERLKNGVLGELLTKGMEHDKYKKVDWGIIPEGWKSKKLSEICEERKEKDYPPYLNKKYVGLEHVDPSIRIQRQFGSSEKVQSITNIFHKGDLLYGKLRPYLNKAAIADFDGICTGEILVIKPNSEISTDFLLLHFKNKQFVEFNTHHAYGTKMPRTSFEILSRFPIGLPDIEEQNKIVNIVNSMDNFILQCKSLIAQNLNLKKKIINDFLSRKLLITTVASK